MDFDKMSVFSKKKIPSRKINGFNILSNTCSQFSTLLHDVNAPLVKKIEGLCNLWLRLLSFVREKAQELSDYIDLICHWSLHIVLNDEWDSLESFSKMCLLSSMKVCKLEICKSMTGPSSCIPKLDALIKIYLKPWNIGFLDKIFNNQKVTTQEVLDYLEIESTIVFERIKMLSQSQCEDLALKLVDHCYRTANEKQAELLLELHFILLYKLNNMEQIANELKDINTQRCIALFQSLIDYSKLPDVCVQSTHLLNCLKSLSQKILEILMNQVSLNNDTNFCQVCDLWMNHVLLEIDDQHTITSMLSSVTNFFRSSEQFYYVCEKISNGSIKTNEFFCIKMLMRALTINTNEFENTEEKEEKKKSAQRLAQGFLQLSSLLKHSSVMVRECLLSSFSLYPTVNLHIKIKEELNALEKYTPSSIWSDGTRIGFSQQECDDLVILLEVHRNSSLSWTLEKQDLEKNCQAHMSNYEKIFEQVPLNHLHVDYSQFDNMPRPVPGMFEGIEKGYEIFLEAITPQNVKDVVKELRFLSEDHSAKIDNYLTSIYETEVQPTSQSSIDKSEIQQPTSQSSIYETQVQLTNTVMDNKNSRTKKISINNDETNIQCDDRELLRKSLSSTVKGIYKKIKTRNTRVSKSLCDNQKPLVPKLNVENTFQCNNDKSKVQRKTKRKKKSKENNEEWKIQTKTSASSQITIGLKRVLYPQRKMDSETKNQVTVAKEKSNEDLMESTSKDPTTKSLRLDAKSEEPLIPNYIDLSSHESVSKLVGSVTINALQHNMWSNSSWEDIGSVSPSPHKKDTDVDSSPIIPISSQDQKFFNFLDQDLLGSVSPSPHKNDTYVDSSPFIPISSQDQNLFNFFDQDLYLREHNYSATKPKNSNILSEHNAQNCHSDEYVDVVDLGEDDFTDSEVDVELVDMNNTSLHPTEAELLSQSIKSRQYLKCDEDFERRLASLSRNVITTINHNPVDLKTLLLNFCSRTKTG